MQTKEVLKQYKAGRISIGRLAEELKISIREAMGLVTKNKAYPRIPKRVLNSIARKGKRL